MALPLCSGPKDTTIVLSSGETVDVWVNKDIFFSNGCLKKHQEFTDISNTNLLSFQWPMTIREFIVTEWKAEITSHSKEHWQTKRQREFAQSTAKELGVGHWEMVRTVMDSCLRNFGAYLLEVSFWNVRLGHVDTSSAQYAKDNRESVIYFLNHLLADTEYLFSDVKVDWSESVLSITPSPVQETSSVVSQEITFQNSDKYEGSSSLFSSCVSRANCQDMQEVDFTNIDEKQLLMQIFEEVHQVKRSVSQLERKVDENYKGLCDRLEEGVRLRQIPDMLPLPHTSPEEAAERSQLEVSEQERLALPPHPRDGREQATQAHNTREHEIHSSSHSSSGDRVSENSRNSSRPQQANQGWRHPSENHHNRAHESTSDSDSSAENASENFTKRSVRNPSQAHVPRHSARASESEHSAKRQTSAFNRDRNSGKKLNASESVSESTSDRSTRNLSQISRHRAVDTEHSNKRENVLKREKEVRSHSADAFTSNRDSNTEGRRHGAKASASSRNSSGERRHHVAETARESPRRNSSQTQAVRQRDVTQNGAVSVKLMAGDDNSMDRTDRRTNIKESYASSRKTANKHSPPFRRRNRASPTSSEDLTNLNQSDYSLEASSNRTSTNVAPSNLPSASGPHPSSSSLPSLSLPSPHPSRHQNQQSSGQQSSPMKQYASQSSTSQVSGFAPGGRKKENSQQQMSSLDDSSSSASSSPNTMGRRENSHQKESFTSKAGMGMSNSGYHSKSEMRLLVETHSEARLVKESVRRAYLEDEVKPPKAKSFDTMLCVDVSGSMKQGGAFEQMKRTVLSFIEGVEDIVTQFGTEENIGLVTFGGRASVVQNLTNDFNLIRDKIELMEPGGKSPFVEALLVAMAAFVGKGGIVSISSEWHVKPRIIFISDGLPTESVENDDVDIPYNVHNVRLSLSNLMMSFKKGDKFNKVHPVFFVPVGHQADKTFMQAMSNICDGVYMEPNNIHKLCHYFRVQETVGKILVCLGNETEDLGSEKIEATLMALTPDLSDMEKQEVIEIAQRELTNPNRTRSRQPRPSELDYVFEDTEKVNKGIRLPLGTRVIRGPDWSHGDQDEGGPGTVINHHEKYSLHWVKWDNGDYNRYAYGGSRGFDIWKTDDHPRLRGDNEPLEIGMTVRKGKEWKPVEGLAEQGCGKGVIIRKSRWEKKVTVRWSNGVIQTCLWSPTGIQEVDYSPPEEDVDPGSQFPKTRPESQDHWEPETITFEGQGVWRWCDENNVWHDYDTETSSQIEAACKKRNPRTCIIKRNGKLCRIMFRKMVEKVIDEGTECKVQRLHISD